MRKSNNSSNSTSDKIGMTGVTIALLSIIVLIFCAIAAVWEFIPEYNSNIAGTAGITLAVGLCTTLFALALDETD